MSEPQVPWPEFVKRCEDMGVLAKQLYVVFTTPADGLGPVMENLEEHLAFQHEIEAKGIMLAAGPFSSDDQSEWSGEGMVIIRAGSKAEAEALAASDPMHRSGARSFRVRPWLMNEGMMTVTLSFSDGRHRVV